MGLVPSTKTGKVAFFNSKISPWTTNATAIGTTSGAVTALQTKVEAALSAIDAQVAAEQAVKTATMTADNAVAAVVTAGSDIIKSIRAKAAVSGNTVYELAEIPDPATPSPVNTLGQPTDFKANLEQDGSLTLTWKCVSPRAVGMVYQVWRKSNTDSEFVYLGGCGTKKFNDNSIASGTASTIYKIQAVRSTAVGPWATFTVLIGSGSSGQLTATVEQPKLAA